MSQPVSVRMPLREFIRSSGMISIGVALARLLGFGFSMVLARVLIPEDYGFIQYSLTLANFVALLTIPFGQHVLARFIGGVKDQPEDLQAFLSTAWIMLLGLVGVTLLVAVPVLALIGRLNLGVIVVFLGFTLHFGYYGLARGFLAPGRLTIAYLGSNVVQLIAIVLVYVVLRETSPMPALIIYGASYLLPIALLQWRHPFPMRFRLALPDRASVRRVLKYAAPIWASHVAYILYAGVDVLLIQHFLGDAAVGVYALTKTLTMLLSFVPTGISTVLLPRIAAEQRGGHLPLVRNTILASLGVNALVLVVMVIGYQPFIRLVFDEVYVVPLIVLLLLALSEIAFGVHGIVTAVLLGSDQPQWETVSRVVVVIVSVLAGVILIPRWGLTGAALMMALGGVAANLTYLSLWLLKDTRHAVVHVR